MKRVFGGRVMNKASKKVENEEMKNKLNDEINVENMEIAKSYKKGQRRYSKDFYRY